MRYAVTIFFALVAITAATTAHAGGDSVMPEDGMGTTQFDDLGPPGFTFRAGRVVPKSMTPEITEALVREIQRGARFCAQLPRVEYALDCLSDRMTFTARLVPRIRGYAELRLALSDASKEIRLLARQNRSNVLPAGSAPLKSGRTRVLVPFDIAKRQLVEERTAEIVSATSSRMWRAAALTTEARGHYEALATALGSYLVLPAFLPST